MKPDTGYFDHERTHGKMRRVFEIANDPTWDLLCEKLSRFSKS